MEQIITVGLDSAKHVSQVHGADRDGAVVVRKKLRREQLLSFFAELPRCTVAMEACGGAHWAREIGRLGHEVKLIAPACVKPYVKRQKNDMADAEDFLSHQRHASPPRRSLERRTRGDAAKDGAREGIYRADSGRARAHDRWYRGKVQKLKMNVAR